MDEELPAQFISERQFLTALRPVGIPVERAGRHVIEDQIVVFRSPGRMQLPSVVKDIQVAFHEVIKDR